MPLLLRLLGLGSVARAGSELPPGLPRVVSSVLLVVANLVPVWGVLHGDLGVGDVFVLYWIENVAVWLVTIVKIATAQAPEDPTKVTMTMNGRRVAPDPRVMAGFFAFHYGLFTLVHGVFVFLIAAGVFSGIATTTSATSMAATAAAETGLAGVDGPGILIIWIIAGIAQLLIAARGPLPARRGTALMMSAYPRMIVLHLGVIGGAILIAESGWPPIAAVLLIALHGIVDAFEWMLSARRANRPGSAPTVSVRLG